MTSEEWAKRVPKYERVLDELKQSVSSRSTFSRFSFLAGLLYIKSHYRVSNNYFDALLVLLSDAFSSSNVPKSCEEAHKYIRELGQGYESIHVCEYNYVLFWGDHEELQACAKCKESRWEDADGSKRVPHKVLRHFPLIPRLQRIFVARGTAADAEWHKTKREKKTGEMSHLADGEAWQHFDRKHKTFADDPRNLRLAIAIDGFNPFGNFSSTYSMWPILVTPLNLPPWECANPSNCFMSLLILGPTSPGKDFDVFLEPLIEELKELWKGVNTILMYL